MNQGEPEHEFEDYFNNSMQFIRKNERGTFLKNNFKCYSYFSFGSYYNPLLENLGDLQAVVEYELLQEESLKQNTHPNMDIYTLVYKGQTRQDSSAKENNTITQQNYSFIHLGQSNDDQWHKESNNGDQKNNFLQIFLNNKENADSILKENLSQDHQFKIISQSERYKILQNFTDQPVNLQTRGYSITIILLYQGAVKVEAMIKQQQQVAVLFEKDLIILKEPEEVQIIPSQQSQLIFIQLK